MRKVKDIIFEMENFAPNYLKEDFDNVGLMVGDREKDVNRVILALDCTLDVIEEAGGTETSGTTNADVLRRLSNLEKIIYGRE